VQGRVARHGVGRLLAPFGDELPEQAEGSSIPILNTFRTTLTGTGVPAELRLWLEPGPDLEFVNPLAEEFFADANEAVDLTVAQIPLDLRSIDADTFAEVTFVWDGDRTPGFAPSIDLPSFLVGSTSSPSSRGSTART
jgi:hypothetical protein